MPAHHEMSPCAEEKEPCADRKLRVAFISEVAG
jgi:hypothetical protein